MNTSNADLRRLAEQATPGPWHVKTLYLGGPEIWAGPDEDHQTGFQGVTDRVNQPHDAAYIAAANPQAILALLDERESDRAAIKSYARATIELRSRVAALEEGLTGLRDAFGALRSTAKESAALHKGSPEADWYAGSIYAWDEAIKRVDEARAILDEEAAR